jgi:Flp pilus assembly protein TadD
MHRHHLRHASFAVLAALSASFGPAFAQDKDKGGQESAAPATSTMLDDEFAKAQALRIKGDYAGAAKAFGQLMLVAPDDARIVGGYGKTLAQEGQPDGAEPFLKRAIELDPHDYTLYSALGVTLDQLDDHAGARRAYERALSLKGGDAGVLNNYAVSRMLAGDIDGARRLFAQAKAADSDNPKIDGNLAELASMKRAAPPPEAPATAPHANQAASGAPSLRTANAAPRALAGSSVVMQDVPEDPHAGPVAGHPARSGHVTAASADKPAAGSDALPILRTASENP